MTGVRVHFFVKETDFDVKNPADIPKAAAADTVHAAFVFLNLLKSNAEHFGKFVLGEAKHFAPHANPFADVDVDGVRGAVRGTAAGRNGTNRADNPRGH